jgi:hypothetical protein
MCVALSRVDAVSQRLIVFASSGWSTCDHQIASAAKLFAGFMLSEGGQKIIASFGRIPTRRGVPTVQGLDKLNYVIDEIGDGDEFNKNFELFFDLRRA